MEDRSIRVFVSSTFRDMQLERDELVKRVFPQVRRLCERRGVTWSEVDLRWGVTDEQKAEGAVLPICLAEIERTRPYFIGLLGQRYGWVPDEIPATLAEELGWLTDDAGRSVTELEILHGVLNDPEAPGHAFFYLRDPAWVDSLPEAERATFVEDDPAGVRRLQELRDRLTASAFPTRTYADPIALGDVVLADLIALVEERFPDPHPPDPRARAADLHASFGRRLVEGYVARAPLTASIDDAVGADGPPLLLTGPAGAGASALATDWAMRWGADHPGETLIVHHVEADSEAADHRVLIARLVGELGPQPPDGESGERIGDDLVALRGALRQSFAALGGRRVVIVLDGVDRLDDVDGAPDLRWLPDTIPPNVRIVVTASDARPRATFAHRGWSIVELPPLDPAERRDVAVRFLAGYAKGLDEQHLAALTTAPNTGNPRFLRIVLDELRQHGDHFTLGDRIAELCGASTIDDLHELVLSRYERDFERDRPGLTKDALSALWAARRGLSESELLAIVGAGDDQPLPHAVWSPLHLAGEDGLVVRGGLLGIAHADLRRAIEDRYLPTADRQRAAHAVLAAYFARRPLSDRVVDELAWQQAQAGDIEALTRTLGDLGFVEHAYRRSAADIRRLWSHVTDRTAMVASYRDVIDDPSSHDVVRAGEPPRQLVWGVARLLADDGHPAEATRLLVHLVEQARIEPRGSADGPDGDARLRAALLNLGAARWSTGELDAARDVLTEAVERCRSAADPQMLASALGNLAMVERDLGRRDVAEALFEEEADLCRALDDDVGLQSSLGNRAQLLRSSGRYDEALDLLQAQEHCCRNLADPAAVARSLAGQAAVLADRGDVREAIALTEQFEASCRAEGDRRGVAEALLNLAVMHGQLGATEPALRSIGEAETWARELGQPELLARVLVTRASALGQLGEWATAEQVAREAELTARQAQLPSQAAMALGVFGTARREQGDLGGAREAHRAELTLVEGTEDRQAIAIAQSNLATVAIAEERYDEMFERYAIAEALLRELDTPSTLLPLLANRGQVNHMSGRFPEALADLADATEAAARLGHHAATTQWGDLAVQLAYQLGDTVRAERLWELLAPAAEATGDDAALQRALGEQALMLITRSQQAGDPATVDQALLARAAGLLDRQEVVCRRSANEQGLGACLGNRAIVQRFRGQLTESLASIDEQLAICTRIGDGQGVLFATANRGEVLGLLGRRDEALQSLGQARATATAYGLAPMVQQLDVMIAALGPPR